MKKIIVLVSLFLLSCNSSKKVNNETSFENIYKSEIGGKTQFGFEIVDSNEGYLELINRLNLNDLEDEKLLEPNFEENNILVSYLGERNTGGYSIEVESLYWKEKVLYVKTREIKPGKGEMVTMAITKPYCISLIPKTKKIVYK